MLFKDLKAMSVKRRNSFEPRRSYKLRTGAHWRLLRLLRLSLPYSAVFRA